MILKTRDRTFTRERAARRRMIGAAMRIAADDLQHLLMRWIDDDLAQHVTNLPILTAKVHDLVRYYEAYIGGVCDHANDLYREAWDEARRARIMVRDTLSLAWAPRRAANAFEIEVERRLLLLSPLIDLLAPDAGSLACLAAFCRYVRRAYQAPERRERIWDLVAEKKLRAR